MLPDLAKPEKKVNHGRRAVVCSILALVFGMASLLETPPDSPEEKFPPAILLSVIFGGIFTVAAIVSLLRCKKISVVKKKKDFSFSVEHVNRIHYRAQTIRFAAVPLVLTLIAFLIRLFQGDKATDPGNERTFLDSLYIPLFLSGFLWIGAFYYAIRWIAEIAVISNQPSNEPSQFKLPKDVKVVAWYNIICGLLSLLSTTCLASGIYNVTGRQGPFPKVYILGFPSENPFIAIANHLVFGCIMLAIGIGLLQCKRSAWCVLWPVTIYGLISSTVLLFTTPSAVPFIGLLIGLAIIGWLIFRRSLFPKRNFRNNPT